MFAAIEYLCLELHAKSDMSNLHISLYIRHLPDQLDKLGPAPVSHRAIKCLGQFRSVVRCRNSVFVTAAPQPTACEKYHWNNANENANTECHRFRDLLGPWVLVVQMGAKAAVDRSSTKELVSISEDSIANAGILGDSTVVASVLLVNACSSPGGSTVASLGMGRHRSIGTVSNHAKIKAILLAPGVAGEFTRILIESNRAALRPGCFWILVG